ncbi:hypothetical protein BN961_03095 [Afipia felis]|uniref:Uncharacterized protein n=1 Tax=Afipia felis TaxID=1035 RepID=A0A090MQK0_AFIFE|nr:hypothetical protein BN961_03095 [Afipia felis]
MVGGCDDVAGGHCCLIEFRSHVGNRGIERPNAVGKTGANSKIAAVGRGVRPAHRLNGQAAIDGDKCAELGVEAVDVGLDGGPCTLGQRFMSIAVDLLVTSENEAP